MPPWGGWGEGMPPSSRDNFVQTKVRNSRLEWLGEWETTQCKSITGEAHRL